LLGEHNINANEQMIREQAYELWDHARRPEGRRNSGSLREPNSNAGRRHERETSARMFPRMWSRLVMNRALINRKRGLTQLGGPDELACDLGPLN
jgi:hypothetical protein